jgi:ADP-ribosylation factor-like protein 2
MSDPRLACQDLGGAMSAAEIVEVLELQSERFSTRHWTIVGCSAVSGDGLADGIDWIVQDISDRIFMMS